MLKMEDMLKIKIFTRFSEKQIEILHEYIASAERIFFFYRLLCIMTIIFYGICPFIDDLDNALPLPGWIPYDVSKNIFLYIATFVFQMITITMSAYNNSTFDTIDCMLITVASALFDVLMDNMRTINYRSNNSNQLLKNNIEFHVELLR